MHSTIHHVLVLFQTGEQVLPWLSDGMAVSKSAQCHQVSDQATETGRSLIQSCLTKSNRSKDRDQTNDNQLSNNDTIAGSTL